MLSRLIAIVLITLVVSPFTAPFSTCDLAVVNSFHQDSISAAKAVQEVTAIPCFGACGILLEHAEVLTLTKALSSADFGTGRPLVLRL